MPHRTVTIFSRATIPGHLVKAIMQQAGQIPRMDQDVAHTQSLVWWACARPRIDEQYFQFAPEIIHRKQSAAGCCLCAKASASRAQLTDPLVSVVCRQRQGSITGALLEIVSGANAAG